MSWEFKNANIEDFLDYASSTLLNPYFTDETITYVIEDLLNEETSPVDEID